MIFEYINLKNWKLLINFISMKIWVDLKKNKTNP